MKVTKTGKIVDDFYVVGNIDVPVYLLDCSAPVIFDSGFSTLRHHYQQDVRRVLGNRAPGFLFLTHSHWDHIGCASYFKELWPNMKIVGSSRISHVLNHRRALDQINDLNLDAIRTLEGWGITDISRDPFEPFEIDIALDGEAELKINEDLTVQAIPTPGHTRDSFSYWIPSHSILVAGEAVICDGVCDFLVDIEAYLESLKRLKRLEVNVLCIGHRLVVTGDEAKEYIELSIGHTKRYVEMVAQILRDVDFDVDKAVEKVKSVEWDPKPLPKQPEKPYLINTRIRVEKVQKQMKQGDDTFLF